MSNGRESSQPTISQGVVLTSLEARKALDLTGGPTIFVTATHLDLDDLHELEDNLSQAGASLTYDINEAEVILSKVTKKARIQFDLRVKGLWTTEVTSSSSSDAPQQETVTKTPAVGLKRKRDDVERSGNDAVDAILLDDSSTEDEESVSVEQQKSSRKASLTSPMRDENLPHRESTNVARIINVARVDWFTDSAREGTAMPLEQYTTYIGRVIERRSSSDGNRGSKFHHTPAKSSLSSHQASNFGTVSSPQILERAKDDQADFPPRRQDRFGRRKFGLNVPSANPASWEAGHGADLKYAHLLHTTTTEQDNGVSSDIPEPPEWVKRGVKYACQRPTPRTNPNGAFISLLKEIKLARLLTNDEIGVRAYATSIASLAAYPYQISNPREIMALPGCDHKIANLFVEFANTGKIQAVEDLEADAEMKVLKLFYNIWGVGATTAREFYYDRGWSDLDDIVENGWQTLSRVQQIGVKFYDEFLDPIPREEVTSIGEVIHRHAVKVRDDRIQSIIVGGYRRGKAACGDVDIVVSHPEESMTANLVEDIISSLEEEEWVTHTLLLALTNTHRGQETLPYRTGGGGHGFDSLDKALVVWQDPAWPTRERDLAENGRAKNPNIHRRVDIIISPWRTVGCAVVGWSGGTTFQRDLRRYAKNVKGWKFDSSGVRDRRNGEVVDIEGFFHWEGKDGILARAKTTAEAERRVFAGFGIEYREPWERCTG